MANISRTDQAIDKRKTVCQVIKYDLSYVRWKQFGKLWSINEKNELDLRPMTLKFNRVRAVVKVHVRAKFHRAKCSGSWVIVRTEKKTPTKTIQPVATARTVTMEANRFQNCPIARPTQSMQFLCATLYTLCLCCSLMAFLINDDAYWWR